MAPKIGMGLRKWNKACGSGNLGLFETYLVTSCDNVGLSENRVPHFIHSMFPSGQQSFGQYQTKPICDQNMREIMSPKDLEGGLPISYRTCFRCFFCPSHFPGTHFLKKVKHAAQFSPQSSPDFLEHQETPNLPYNPFSEVHLVRLRLRCHT